MDILKKLKLLLKSIKCIIAALSCMLFTNTFAQTASNPDIADISERIEFIQNELNREQVYAATWTCGWTIFNGASAAYFYYRAKHTGNKAKQVNDMVIGVGSTLAVVGNVATPMVSMYAPYFLKRLPETTREEKSVKLAKAEDYLTSGSDLEEFGQSWIAHSINLITASTGAIVVGAVYRKTMIKYGKNPAKEALITFVECFLSGELQIMSQPMDLVGSKKKYNQKYGSFDQTQDQKFSFFIYPSLDERRGLIAGVSKTF